MNRLWEPGTESERCSAFYSDLRFALAVPRFDQRRELIVLEANAIGTTSLRAQMLPEPERSVVQQLLRQYVDARLDLKATGPNAEKIQAALVRSKRLQNELWRQAAAVAQRSPTPITGLFRSIAKRNH